MRLGPRGLNRVERSSVSDQFCTSWAGSGDAVQA
ncbi:unnamed protein product [Brassica napus]|uniref:(rape) hypothetical protein n=1 Tax=Brassica napus TaxID=3708 RepID=A0A816UGF5_BRANA|nr:unnamed protein product [Brassica napus]